MSRTKVLIVDDNAAFAEFVRMAALDDGYDAEVCANGALAKDVYETFNPDVIVLDCVMPEVDGIEYLQWLATKNCQSRVILVTGYNPYYADIAEMIGMGKVTALMKPVQLPDLRKAMANKD